MKFVVIGAGGTGGPIGAYMTRAGKDVTLIARGAHLQAMREHGMTLRKTWGETEVIAPVKASSMDEFQGTADVIFVCVKGYSLEETIPFIRRISGEHTVVIPILNIYGTGGRLQEQLPGILVTDGCIYISANLEGPGQLLMHGQIFRIVFGVRKKEEYRPVLEQVVQELKECGIEGILSEDIRRDALVKFSYVSPAGVCGLWYQAPAAAMQQPGEARERFCSLVDEISRLGEAMGITFQENLVERNLKILDDLAPEATTSMQRDVYAGKRSEIEGLLFEVVRMGKDWGVDLPCYGEAAQRFSKLRNIRMIGLDLDGTVFNNDKEITAVTRKVLGEAIRQGVVVLPATGRPRSGLPQAFLEIPGVRYAVTANGSRIVDLETEEAIYQCLIPWERTQEVIEEMEACHDGVWEAYFDGKCYVDRDEYVFVQHPDMTPAMVEYIRKSRNAVPNLKEYMRENKIGVEKLHMVFADTKKRNQMLERLKRHKDLDVSFATSFNLEVISSKAGKGNGLLELGKILGIPREGIMACGDAPNDWDMLRKAGFAVVMGNADEETKKLADVVTESNQEDGVARAVERYILRDK